jgi:hypothetical protein
MCEKKCLRPFDELGKLIEVVEYLSRYTSETINAKDLTRNTKNVRNEIIS